MSKKGISDYWKPVLGGLAVGVSLAGLIYSFQRRSAAESDEKLLRDTSKLAEVDFVRAKSNILWKITKSREIKFTVAQLESIYAAFSGLLERKEGAGDKKAGFVGFRDMRKLYSDIYAQCGFEIKSSGRAQNIVDRMMNAFDKDGDRNIDFVEVVRELNRMAFSGVQARVEAVFKLFDASNDKVLQLSEVQDIVNFSAPGVSKKDRDNFVATLERLDTNRNGVISLDQWRAQLTNAVMFNTLFNKPNAFEIKFLDFFGVKLN